MGGILSQAGRAAVGVPKDQDADAVALDAVIEIV
jgi:hypothetical protein